MVRADVYARPSGPPRRHGSPRASASACPKPSTCTPGPLHESLLPEPRHPRSQPRLVRLHQRRALQGRPKRGSIDPLLPSKVGIPHVHNLLYHKHTPKKPLITSSSRWSPFPLAGKHPRKPRLPHRHCPGSRARRLHQGKRPLRGKGHRLQENLPQQDNPALCAKQMYEDWAELGLSMPEARRHRRLLEGPGRFLPGPADEARAMLHPSEQQRPASLFRRPYHNDPGINHNHDEPRSSATPSSPRTASPSTATSSIAFGEESPWRNRQRIRYRRCLKTATGKHLAQGLGREICRPPPQPRRPRTEQLKCGHDAPIYTVIEEMLKIPALFATSRTSTRTSPPELSRSASKPSHFKRYREDMIARAEKIAEIEADSPHMMRIPAP